MGLLPGVGRPGQVDTHKVSTLVVPLPGGGMSKAIRRTVTRRVLWRAYYLVWVGLELSGENSSGEYTDGYTAWCRQAQGLLENIHKASTLEVPLPVLAV